MQFHNLSQIEICQLIDSLRTNNILRLDIPMYYLFGMQMLNRLSYVMHDLILKEHLFFSFLIDVITYVS